MLNLTPGQRFTAHHSKLGTIPYEYVGVENTCNGYDIHLKRLDDNTDTYVE